MLKCKGFTKGLSMLLATMTAFIMLHGGQLMATAAEAEKTTLDISSGSIAIGSGTVDGYDANGNHITSANPEGYIIIGASSAHTVTVSGGAQSITLSGVNIDVSNIAGSPAFSIESGATVNLALCGDNILKGGFYCASLQVETGAAVNISGSAEGNLTATGDVGIGSYMYNSGGTMCISGGTVNTAGRGNEGWGIYTCGTVIVTGGTLHATGSGDGDGVRVDIGALGISGGTVAAAGGLVGEGICCDGATVNISGGTVTAASGSKAIRAGIDMNSGWLNISGGTVTATGNASGMGIVASDCPVNITDGMVTATGGAYGIEISGDPFKITGGSVYSSSVCGAITDDSGTAEHCVTVSGFTAGTTVACSVNGGKTCSCRTDTYGKLYLWMPAGDDRATIYYNSQYYGLKVNIGTSDTSVTVVDSNRMTVLDVGRESIDLSDSGVTGKDVFGANASANPYGYVITGTTASNGITVSGTQNIVLKNVDIELHDCDNYAIEITKGSKLYITFDGNSANILSDKVDDYGTAVIVGSNALLSVTGTDSGKPVSINQIELRGTLNVRGGMIEMNDVWTNGYGGKINISGGTVTVSHYVWYYNDGSLAISGGTVTAAGEGIEGNNWTVTGGSVNANSMSYTPSNGSSSVYPATITLPSGTNVSAIFVRHGRAVVPYGINDVHTDGSGRLYLYLPVYSSGDTTVDVIADGKIIYTGYHGKVSSGTNTLKMNQSALTVTDLNSVYICGETISPIVSGGSGNGAVNCEYMGTNGTSYSGSTPPAEVGNYSLTATREGTDVYYKATVTKSFLIQQEGIGGIRHPSSSSTSTVSAETTSPGKSSSTYSTVTIPNPDTGSSSVPFIPIVLMAASMCGIAAFATRIRFKKENRQLKIGKQRKGLMKKFRKSAFLILLAFLITSASVFGGCSVNQKFVVKKTIGALLPITGSLASQGKQSLEALKIAKADLAATYGYSVNLITADSSSSDAVALEKLKEFYNQGIRIVIGPYSSSQTTAVEKFADSHGMVIISPTSTTMSLRKNDNILRLSLNDSKLAQAQVDLLKNRGISQVVVVYADSTYGKDMYNTFGEQLKKNNTDIQLADSIAYDSNASDFSGSVKKIHDSVQKTENTVQKKNIGVLLIGYDEAVNILKASASDNLLENVKWFGTDSLAKKNIVVSDKTAADFATKTEFTALTDDRQAFSMPIDPFSYLDQHLINKLAKNGLSNPDSSVYQTYDAFMLGGITLSKANANQLQNMNFKNSVVAMAKNMYGTNARLAFDEVGDIINGSIGFYKVTKNGNNPRWVLTGGYQFRLNTGSQHPTNTLFYREYDSDIRTSEITVGALMPLTGSLSSIGKSALKTINQAQQDISDTLKNYYSGSPSVSIVSKDTKSDAETALQELKELKAQGIHIVIGPYSTNELATVRQYANENHILLISPGCTATSIGIPGNTFRLSLNDNKQAQAMVGYCSKQGLNNVYVLMNDTMYSKDLYESFKNAYSKAGGTVNTPIVYKQGDNQSCLNELNQKIGQLADKTKTAVLLISYGESTQLLQEASAYSNLASVQWMGTDSTSLSSELIKSSKAAGFASKTKFTASIMSSPVRESGKNISVVTDVIYHDLSSSLGYKLSSYDTNSYDTVWICALMYINRDWNFTSFADFKNALTAVTDRMVSINGSVKFDSNGDRIVGNFAFNRVIGSNQKGYTWKTVGSYFTSQTVSKSKYFSIN